MANNNVIQNYSKIADKYEQTLGSISQFLLAEIQNFYQYLPKNSFVIDAGCGPGIEAEIGLSYGHSITGLDLCPEMLKRYQSRNKSSNTILADMSAIPMHDNSVDAVFSSCAILHQTKLQGIASLSELFRILKPGGKMFLITTIHDGQDEIYTNLVLKTQGVNDLYFFHWQKRDLLEEISLLGFQIKNLSEFTIKENRPNVIVIDAIKC